MHTFNFELGCFAPPAAARYGCDFNWKTFYPSRLVKFALRSKRSPDILENGADNEDEREKFIPAGDQHGDGVHDKDILFPHPEIANRMRGIALRYSALSPLLRCELTRTLCFPVLEQIRSLVLPLSDLVRYLDVVDRFHSLSSVTFKMDELLLLTPLIYQDLMRLLRRSQYTKGSNKSKMIDSSL